MRTFTLVTVATAAVLNELRALRWSANEFIGAPLLVAGDEEVCKWVRSRRLPGEKMDCVQLPEAFDLRRAGYAKTFALRQALARADEALYCDADVLFLGTWRPRLKPGVTMSPHLIDVGTARRHGYWNSGYIGVTREGAAFCDWWDAAEKETPRSYGDQQCLDNCPHRTAAFGAEHNVGWWRWNFPPDDASNRGMYWTDDSGLMWNGLPVVSIHSHILDSAVTSDNARQAAVFNHAALTAMRVSNSRQHHVLLGNLARVAGFNEHPESDADKAARWDALEVSALRLMAARRLAEAAQYFAHLTATPRAAPAFNNLAACCREMGDVSAALVHCRRALSLCEPGDPQRWTYERNVAGLLLLLGQTELAGVLFMKAAEHAPPAQQHEPWSSKLFATLCTTDNAEQLRTDAGAWGLAQGATRRTIVIDGIVRVGYLSVDFGPHPVGHFIEPVIAHHDTKQFHTYLYSGRAYEGDARYARMKAAAGERWRDVAALDDDSLAQTIMGDNLDILVELGGHTGESRVRVMRRRMARTQLSYLGYPATSGIPTIDAKIVDYITDPGGGASEYVESGIIRLTRCFVAWQPEENAPPVGAPPEGPPVLGCFSSANKLSPQCVELFAKVMQSIPDARLALKNQAGLDPGSRVRFEDMFSACGVDPARIEWWPWSSTRVEHLARYADVTVALDTFPYNCTTTTCEALWQGVPVVTLAGRTHHSRNGASLLHAAGLRTLVAPTIHGYVSAVNVAVRTGAGMKARCALREQVRESPLCDTDALATAIESEYLQLWKCGRAL